LSAWKLQAGRRKTTRKYSTTNTSTAKSDHTQLSAVMIFLNVRMPTTRKSTYQVEK